MAENSPMTRRVPSLLDHLEAEPRGMNFEAWTAALLGIQQGDVSPQDALFTRLLHTFSVACVEQMNREMDRDSSREGVSAAISMWARAAGFSTIVAVASVSEDGTELRRLARVLAEEFKIGGKLAADTCVKEA